MAAGACVEKSLAKEFSVGGVDQGVRRQDLRQAGERAPGGEEKAATGEFVALRLQACLEAADRAESEASCLGLRARDDATGLAGRHFLRSVVGLAEFVSEGFDEVNAFAREDDRRTFLQSQRHEGGPAGVDAKADGGGFGRAGWHGGANHSAVRIDQVRKTAGVASLELVKKRVKRAALCRGFAPATKTETADD